MNQGTKSAAFCLLLLAAFPARSTEFLKLQDHPDLRSLYNSANSMYRAATGCESGQDCICLHKDEVSRYLEKTLKIHIGFPSLVDTFILDEQGVLKSERGAGALVSVSDLDAMQRHLHGCDHPNAGPAPEGEAQQTLRAIVVVEAGYYAVHHEYAPIPSVGYSGNCKVPYSVGFALDGCEDGKLRYTYSARVTKKGSQFIAEARSAKGADHPIVVGCAIEDVWTIDQDQRLRHVVDANARCPKLNAPASAPRKSHMK